MDPDNPSLRYPKPKGNTVLNVALTFCFGGLFLLLAMIASVALIILAGDRILISNFTYLFAVLIYLGLIVGGLIATGLNQRLPRWTSPWQASTATPQPMRPVASLLRAAPAHVFVARSPNSAWFERNRYYR
ncbi:MAG TPA: hypothetical protein VKT73_04475 [Xanthobacteraceae bacterium]|nr:hypothetical protein [Xanthobacteraceae bacterium]